MAKLVLSVNRAEKAEWSPDVVSIIFDGKTHFPPEAVEIKTAADAEKALNEYTEKAKQSGLGLAVFASLARGERAPRGFKKLKWKRYVNV